MNHVRGRSSGCTIGRNMSGCQDKRSSLKFQVSSFKSQVSSLKSQASSLTRQNLARFLRFRLEPCYLRLQVAGLFSNLLGRSETSSECQEIALHGAENLRARQREVVLRVVGAAIRIFRLNFDRSREMNVLERRRDLRQVHHAHPERNGTSAPAVASRPCGTGTPPAAAASVAAAA